MQLIKITSLFLSLLFSFSCPASSFHQLIHSQSSFFFFFFVLATLPRVVLTSSLLPEELYAFSIDSGSMDFGLRGLRFLSFSTSALYSVVV